MKSLYFLLYFLGLVFAQDQLAFLRNGNRLSSPDFYKEIAAPQETNVMFSPLSAEIALLFLYSGSGGNTAREIVSALQLESSSKQVIQHQTKILIERLLSYNFTFNIASGLFVQENYEIKEQFLTNAYNIFQALCQNVDFENSLDTVDGINKWVAHQTRNKIPKLVDAHSLSSDTKVVLVNALYFQDSWRFPFINTRKPEIFYKSPSETVEANYMFLEHYALAYSHSNFLKAHFIQLYFKGGDASMVLVVPEERFGLDNIERYPHRIFAPRKMSMREMKLKMPSFLIRSTFALVPELQKLGIVDAFRGSANFTGISDDPISVTDVIQKTYIQINKYGIESAAGTITIHARTYYDPPSFAITVNHPFAFYIEINGFILFFGKVYDPSEKN